MKTSPNIGRAELEILRYVAEQHPVSVGQVAAHVARTRGHVRTTVLNVMERLRKKGYLTRRKIDGVYRYAPSVPKSDLFRNLVRDFVDKALGGSLSPFMAYLAQDAKLTDKDIVDLRRIVRELEGPNRERGS